METKQVHFVDKLLFLIRVAGVDPMSISSVESFQQKHAPHIFSECFKVLYPDINTMIKDIGKERKKKKKQKNREGAQQRGREVDRMETVLNGLKSATSSDRMLSSLSQKRNVTKTAKLLQTISAQDICDGNPVAIGIVIGILYNCIKKQEEAHPTHEQTQLGSTAPTPMIRSRSPSPPPATFEPFETRTTDLPSNPYVKHLTTDPPPDDMTLLSNINRLKLRDMIKSELLRTMPSNAAKNESDMGNTDDYLRSAGTEGFFHMIGGNVRDMNIEELEFRSKRRGFGVFMLKKLVRKAKGRSDFPGLPAEDTACDKSPSNGVNTEYLNESWSVDILGGEIGEIVDKAEKNIEKKVIKKYRRTASNRRKMKSTSEDIDDHKDSGDVFLRLYSDASSLPQYADYLNSKYLESLGLTRKECRHLLRSKSDAAFDRNKSSRAIPNTVNGEKVYISYDHQTGHKLHLSTTEFVEQDRKWKLKNGEPSEDELQLLEVRKEFTVSKPSMSDYKYQLEDKKEDNKSLPQWPGYNTGQRTDAWIKRARKEILIEKFSKIKDKRVSHSSNQALSELASQSNQMLNFRTSAEFDDLSKNIESLDLIIAIEHCHSCEHHQMGLRHDPHQYVQRADSFLKILTNIAHSSRLCCRVGVTRFEAPLSNNGVVGEGKNKYGTAASRVGAFEVHILYQPQSGKEVITEILHSKLFSQRWPSKTVIEKRFRSFLSKVNIPTYDSSVLNMEPDFQMSTGQEEFLRNYPIGPIIPIYNCATSVKSWEFPYTNGTEGGKVEKTAVNSKKDTTATIKKAPNNSKSSMVIQWSYDCKVAASMHFFQTNENVYVNNIKHPRGGIERHHLIGILRKIESEGGQKGALSIRLKYHKSDILVESRNCITFGSLSAPVMKTYSQDAFPCELGLVIYYVLNPSVLDPNAKLKADRWRLIDSDDVKNVKTNEVHLTRSSFFHQIRNLVWDLENNLSLNNAGFVKHPLTGEEMDLQCAYNESILDWVFGRHGNLVNMSDLESLATIQFRRLESESQLKNSKEVLLKSKKKIMKNVEQPLTVDEEVKKEFSLEINALVVEKSSNNGFVSPRPAGSPRPIRTTKAHIETAAIKLVTDILGSTGEILGKEEEKKEEMEIEEEYDESADYGDDFDPLSPVRKTQTTTTLEQEILPESTENQNTENAPRKVHVEADKTFSENANHQTVQKELEILEHSITISEESNTLLDVLETVPLISQVSISLSQYLADSDNSSDDMSAAAMHELMGASSPSPDKKLEEKDEKNDEETTAGKVLIVRENKDPPVSRSPLSSDDDDDSQSKQQYTKSIKNLIFDDEDVGGYSDDDFHDL